MARGKKLSPLDSILITKLFDKIPAKDVAVILKEKDGMMSKHEDHIRLQIWSPMKAYVVLRYLGAFDVIGESGFYSNLANDYIHKRMKDLGLLDNMMSNGNGDHHA